MGATRQPVAGCKPPSPTCTAVMEDIVRRAHVNELHRASFKGTKSRWPSAPISGFLPSSDWASKRASGSSYVYRDFLLFVNLASVFRLHPPSPSHATPFSPEEGYAYNVLCSPLNHPRRTMVTSGFVAMRRAPLETHWMALARRSYEKDRVSPTTTKSTARLLSVGPARRR